MKERPILFSGPMVRAILEGRKTQTRRVVKPAVPVGLEKHFPFPTMRGGALEWREKANQDFPMYMYFWRCPYGQPGDRLWVRETWRVGAWRDDGRMALDYAASPELTNTPWVDRQAMAPGVLGGLVMQSRQDCERAGLKAVNGAYKWDAGRGPCRWRPSIHMPRWASRITLEVTEVRVQRLQDISEEDARAEGVKIEPPISDRHHRAFQRLWDSINGQRPGCDWASNPWVWAVSFKPTPATPKEDK